MKMCSLLSKYTAVTVVAILVIILIVGSLWMIQQTRSPTNIEPFQVNRTLTDNVEANQREKMGMERCDALFSTDNRLSADSFKVMMSMVGGHRIKRWKPDPTDPKAAKIKPDKDYCYFYNDTDNNVQDYIMRHTTCDKNNPIFKNPVISDVFSTQHSDRAHTVPVSKCVVEIDRKQAANPANIERLWQDWGATDCDQLMTDIRDSIASTYTSTKMYNGKYTSMYAPYMTVSNLVVSKTNNLHNCTLCNNDYKTRYAELMSDYSVMTGRLMTEKRSVNQQAYDNFVLQENVSALSDKAKTTRDAYVREEANVRSCNKVLGDCQINHENLVFNYTTTLQRNADLKQNNIVLAEDVYSWNQNFQKIQGLVQTCSNNVRSEQSLFATYNQFYTASNSLYNKCINDRASFSNLATQTMDRYESYSNQYYKCSDDVFENTKKLVVEQETLSACQARVGFLTKNIHELRVSIDAIKKKKDSVVVLNTQTMNSIRNCETIIGDLESKIDELTNRRDAMIRELENMNQSIKDAEQTGYMGQLSAIKEATRVNLEATLEATMRAAELGCAAVQSRASDLRNQITTLKAAQIEAAAMPLVSGSCPTACTPSRKQCVPYWRKLCRWTIAEYRSQTTMWFTYTMLNAWDPVWHAFFDRDKGNLTFPEERVFKYDPQTTKFQYSKTVTKDTTYEKGWIVMTPINNPTQFKWNGILASMPTFDKYTVRLERANTFELTTYRPVIVVVYPPFQVSKEVSAKVKMQYDNFYRIWIPKNSSGEKLVLSSGSPNGDPGVTEIEMNFKPGVTYQIMTAIHNKSEDGYLTFDESEGLDAIADVLMRPPDNDTYKAIVWMPDAGAGVPIGGSARVSDLPQNQADYTNRMVKAVKDEEARRGSPLSGKAYADYVF